MRITRASHIRRSHAGRLATVAVSAALIGLLALNPLLSTAASAQPEPAPARIEASGADLTAHAAPDTDAQTAPSGESADTASPEALADDANADAQGSAAGDERHDVAADDIDEYADATAGSDAHDAEASAAERSAAPQEMRASGVASIDGVGYSSLNRALAAAIARIEQGQACTVIVHQSTTVAPDAEARISALPVIPAGGHLTIEAAAGTSPTIRYDSSNAPSGQKPLLAVQGNGAALTLRGLTLSGTSRTTPTCYNRALDALDGAQVDIENCTITGFAAPAKKGASLPSEAAEGSGAAVRVESGSRVQLLGATKIERCGAKTNLSSRYNLGGAVYVNKSTFAMHDSSSIDNCIAYAAGGVMVTNNSTFTMDGTSSITNTSNFGTTTDNRGGGARGGAVYVRGASTFTMDGQARIENCSANDGVVAVGRWRYNPAIDRNAPDDNSTFTMRGNATISNNTALNFGIVSIWGTAHVVVGGNATLQGNRMIGSEKTRVVGTLVMDAVNYPSTGDNCHPTLTVTDNACISNNAIGKEDGRLNLDITSASAIGSRRCSGTITINGNAHVVDNISYSGLDNASAVTVYEGTTLKLGGNAVIANNKNPNSIAACGILQWDGPDYGRIELSGAPTVTGNTGKNGQVNDLRLSKRKYVLVTGDLTGGSIGVTASRVPSTHVVPDSNMNKLNDVFGFTAATSAASVKGLEHIFNNDDPTLRAGAGSGNKVIWTRTNTDPDNPTPTPPDDQALLRIEKHVRIENNGLDTIDRTHAFSMEAVLDAPWQNVHAVVYNADGTPALDKNGHPVKVDICAYAGGDTCLPGDQYGCGSQTLIQFKLADGQYLLVSGIAGDTTFRTRETDPQVKRTPHAAASARYTPSETLDGDPYTSSDTSDATLVTGSITGTAGNPTTVAYTNTASSTPPTGLADGSDTSALRMAIIGFVGAAVLAGSRMIIRHRRR